MGMNIQLGNDFVNTVKSPDKFALRSQGKNFPVEGLGDEEAQLLQNQLNTLIADLDSQMLTHLIVQRQDAIARAAGFSKQHFDEKLFGGINAADNEIGFSVLRPGQILESSGSSVVSDINDWYADPAGSTGWVDWIGDGGSNNKSVDQDDVLLPLAFMDQSSNDTAISAINVDTFGRNVDMLPLDVNDARTKDNETGQQVVPVPSLIAQDGDSIHIRARWDRDVERQPRLYGFSFSLGSRLNNEDF
jgi:hypothetical protein